MEKTISGEVPETELCYLETEGPVAIITISRKEVFNALNAQLISELIDLIGWTSSRSVGKNNSLEDSNGTPYFRALVLKSEGKHFCAGADVNMMRDAGAASPEENRRDSKRLDTLFNSLWSHPCFTICCVQGVALGGGAGLVSCADHVIAEPDTRIALSEGKLGILPAVIGPYVYRKIGSSQFRRLSMLASRIDSVEALRIGWVNELVENNKFDNLFDDLFSIEDVKIYKPDPSVYELPVKKYRINSGEITFLSANTWDVSGGGNFGYNSIWVNRHNSVFDILDFEPKNEINNLTQLLDKV